MNIMYALVRRPTGKSMAISNDNVPAIGTYLTMTNGYYDEAFKAISSEKFVDDDGAEFTKVTYEGDATKTIRTIYFH